MSPAVPAVFKRPEIGIAPEVGFRLHRVVPAGLNRQIQAGGAVKLKEDRIGARLYHGDPRSRGARHRGPGQAEGGLGRLGGGTVQVGAHPHIVGAVDPGREAIAVLCCGGRCLLKGGVGLGELEMVTPHGDVGGLAVVIAGATPVHIRPVVHILGFHHGDRRLAGVAQELEGQIAIKVAEAVAAAHVVG